MPTDFDGILRDVIVLGYMFVLRIGVPLLITIMLGKWLQLKLEQRDAERRGAAQGELYCWDKNKNAQTLRAKAAATDRPDLPCWLALQASGDGLIENCYTCRNYHVRTRTGINGQRSKVTR